MGTAYRLIGETILPHLDSDAGQRILVAVNQADVAMKGNHWDYEKNLPDETLQKFLEEKVSSIQRRILESNGLQTDPIYYCAGYTDESGEQRRAYNLNKLLLQILRALKSEKVLVLADNINEDESMWTDDDGKENYSESIARSFGCIIKDCIDDGFETGGVIGGMIAGIPGAVVATAGCILPSCIIVTILARLYLKYRNLDLLQGVLKSLRPAVVAMIASAGILILKNAFWGSAESISLTGTEWSMVVIFGICVLLLRKTKLNPIWVMVLAGVMKVGISAMTNVL